MFGVTVGMAIGIAVVFRWFWLTWALLLPMLGLYWWVFQYRNSPLDKYMTVIGKQRMRYLHGAQAECLVGWLLDDLPDTWHVWHNVRLEEQRDIDHILVGPPGVFVLSTKGSKGLLSRDAAGRYLHNNAQTPMVAECKRQTMQLKDRLTALLGADVPFLHAVLAVPLMWVDFPSRQQNVWVLHEQNLRQTIEEAPKRLSTQEIDRLADAVDMLAKRSAKIFRRPEAETAGPPAAEQSARA